MSIDLRSDTVTRPTPAMRQAMAVAEVGDDVFGDDPTVNRLQAVLAERLGKAAGLFVSSGTQSNLLALMSHCERGDEYLVGQLAHCYRYEGGGAAVLGSIQPQPLPQQPQGELALADVAAAIKPDDPHFARTRLLCLENTWNGQPLAPSYLHAATVLAHERGLATHLDGARLMNAAVHQAGPGGDAWAAARQIVAGFDTVSVCLSKGLGAPVGSVLCGPQPLIDRARRWRKVLGGGMRQAGVLAAAGLHALDHHVLRLADDHALAARLAQGLAGLPGLSLRSAATNIVFVDVAEGRGPALLAFLAEHGVLATGLIGLRFVTHLDVTAADVDRCIALVAEFLAKPPVPQTAGLPLGAPY